MSIVQEAYDNNELPNNLFIVNLCDKRETKPKNLLKEDFTKNDEDIINEIMKIQQKNQVKWIWVAFGNDKKINENGIRLRLNVLDKLPTNKSIKGKVIGDKDCWHPIHINCNKTYRQKIIKEINEKL